MRYVYILLALLAFCVQSFATPEIVVIDATNKTQINSQLILTNQANRFGGDGSALTSLVESDPTWAAASNGYVRGTNNAAVGQVLLWTNDAWVASDSPAGTDLSGELESLGVEVTNTFTDVQNVGAVATQALENAAGVGASLSNDYITAEIASNSFVTTDTSYAPTNFSVLTQLHIPNLGTAVITRASSPELHMDLSNATQNILISADCLDTAGSWRTYFEFRNTNTLVFLPSANCTATALLARTGYWQAYAHKAQGDTNVYVEPLQ